jgi:putative Holliday junction resolvase
MALDLGTRTIGVAVSDVTGLIANGIETIRRTSPERDFSRLEQLVAQWEIGEIVLGYPKNMNGTIGERAKVSEQFAEELKNRFPGISVVLWDERLSTVAAERVLIDADLQRKKRRKVIDMMAAVVILQNYLDSRSLRRS